MQPDRHEHESGTSQRKRPLTGSGRRPPVSADVMPAVERRQRPRVRAPISDIPKPIKLEDYGAVIGVAELDELRFLAQGLRGKGLQVVNPPMFTDGGTGVVKRLVSLLQELDVPARIVVPEIVNDEQLLGDLSAAVADESPAGQKRLRDAVLSQSDSHAKGLNLDEPFVVIHDLPYAGMVKPKSRNQSWIWRCSFDLSQPGSSNWSWLKPILERYDAAVFSSQRFAPALSIAQYLFYPCIDPLSEVNKSLDPGYVQRVCERFGIDRSRPVITQIASFRAANETAGVLQSYQQAKRDVDCQLVLVDFGDGDATDTATLNDAKAAAERDPDIILVETPSASEINALQRVSTIVVHKPSSELSGLPIAEAMWKGKAVIGSAVGVIPNHIIHKITGFLVHSVDDCATQIRHLLQHRDIAEQLGHNAREHVKENFLITSSVKRWLLLFQILSGKPARS